MIVERDIIDLALADWSNLGFSPESLNILKGRLYDRVFCEYHKKWSFFGDYVWGFDSSKNAHIITYKLLKNKEKEINNLYHGIRHCASAEIFHILLDKESELYDGLDDEDIKRKVLNVYEISKSPLNTKSIRFQIKIRMVSKETRDIIDEVDNYDGSKLKIITKNKNSLAEALYDLLVSSNYNLSESICMSEQEVIKYSRLGKISLLTFLTTTSLVTYGFTIPSRDFIQTLCMMFGLWLAGASGIVYVFFLRPYGNVGIRNRLKNNIQNIKDPYEQFLGFITTK